MRRRASILCAATLAVLAALLALLAMAAAAPAASTTSPPPVSESEVDPGAVSGGPTAVPSGFPDQPANYEISPQQALRVADQDPKVLARKAELTSSDRLTASLSAEAVDVWEVGYYLNDEKVNLVIVDGETGVATESWTGPAVDWPMARGKSGQFGHVLNAPYVWIPLALIFLLGLWDFRRWRKWVHLDLLVLLSFGISQAFFNAAEIGVSVPLVLPAARLPARPHALDRLPRPRPRRRGGGGVAPDDAGLADDRRRDRPDRAAAGRQPRRLRRHRRRLRGRDRRRQDHPRRADLRRLLPRRQPDRRHLRPRQLLRLRPLRADLPVGRLLGRPPRRSRRRRLLRPRDDRRPLRARPRPGPPPPRGRARTTRKGGPIPNWVLLGTPEYRRVPASTRIGKTILAAGGSAAGSRPGSPIATATSSA